MPEFIPLENNLPQQDQAQAISSPMSDGEIRSAFFTLSPPMTTQAQAMMAQANREVSFRMSALDSTITYRYDVRCEDESSYLT